jgi:predicted N-acyltransferase
LAPPGGEIVPSRRFGSFDEFLASLNQEKRKKIRQERRKVAEAGVTFRGSRGRDISAADWDFFYRCYERTYLEHGNSPYLSRAFFEHMARDMPEHWLLFVGERAGLPIASSLIALHDPSTLGSGLNHSKDTLEAADFNQGAVADPESVAYGRYWGALERVDCLHFEACYYQPLQWCIERGIERFEGGAQGEHKMARALLPVKASSAHWLAHPGFADAVQRFLEREGQGIGDYLEQLDARSPLRKPADA